MNELSPQADACRRDRRPRVAVYRQLRRAVRLGVLCLPRYGRGHAPDPAATSEPAYRKELAGLSGYGMAGSTTSRIPAQLDEEELPELPVLRDISSGFGASAELRPIDPRRGGIIRAVVSLGKPIELLRRLEEPPLTVE